MTSILRQILPNHGEVTKLHLAIEQKSFLQRYLGKAPDELTLLDHYRHLRQLQYMYNTFTELLTSQAFSPKLPESLSALLQRGANIQRDLDFLSPHVSAENKDDILEATKEYVAHLRAIPLEYGSAKNNELVVNFLISILGDLNGGQFLKTYVRKLYQRSGIYSDDAPDNGVQFYGFEKNTVANLTEWLKSFITFHDLDECSDEGFDDDAKLLGKSAIDAFTMQAAIVDELEQTRFGKAVLERSDISVAKNTSTLFNCNSTWKIAAAAAAASITIGVTLAATLKYHAI